jgi:hypothetical protein
VLQEGFRTPDIYSGKAAEVKIGTQEMGKKVAEQI